MKNLLFTAISSVLLSSVFSETIKTEKLPDNSIITYRVDENGKKSGATNIIDSKGKTLLSGSYKNGIRTNDWFCFDKEGHVLLRYNYALKKIISLDDKQISSFQYKIIDKSDDVVKQASVPVPICSIEQFKTLLVSEFVMQLPPKQKAAKSNIKGLVTALISETGNTKYIVKYVLDGYEYKTSVSLDSKAFNVEWIPATYNNKYYKSEVNFEISVSIDPSNDRRFIWNY